MVLCEAKEKKSEQGKHRNKDRNRDESAYNTLSCSKIEAFRVSSAAIRLPLDVPGDLRRAREKKTPTALPTAIGFPAQSTIQPITPVRALGVPNI
jgi:hypothetical protein